MNGRQEMRAADADREMVASRLRSALDEGRLQLHEYDERLQQAYSARTYGELDGLLIDLPPQASAERSAMVPTVAPGSPISPSMPGLPISPMVTGHHRSLTARWLISVWEWHLYVVAGTMAVWTLTCFASGELLYFWPGWVAGPWGAVLTVETVVGLARGEPVRWARKRERKRLAKWHAS